MDDTITSREQRTTLPELFLTFAKIGLITFGGGLAMLPILERELAQKRDWTTSEQLLDYYAIGQSTPGIIAVNVATFLGYNRRGILGAIVATLGVVFPSIIVISILAFFLDTFASYPIVQRALRGINVVVAVLLCSVCVKMGKKAIKDIPGFLICIAAFICFSVLKLSGAVVIPVTAIVGIVIQVIKNRLYTK